MNIEEALFQIKQNIKMHKIDGTTSNQNEREKALLEHITNLQEQLHQASLDIQELTEKDIGCPSWCDKLTNLQEENDKYKNVIDKIKEWVLYQQQSNENLEPYISTDKLDDILELLEEVE